MISARLIGWKISPPEISKTNKKLIDAVEKWKACDLSWKPIKHLFLGGVTFDMHIDGCIEKVPVLVASGVTATGQKLVVGFQTGDKEFAPTWREFFKDLKKRGLDASKMVLDVMDGLPDLCDSQCPGRGV